MPGKTMSDQIFVLTHAALRFQYCSKTAVFDFSSHPVARDGQILGLATSLNSKVAQLATRNFSFY